ncbi:MAG: HEAT repeat domain-containing protein [Turneriella sp.]|nr:HEAT repeat domain-containing protein [Turneriella sp.]
MILLLIWPLLAQTALAQAIASGDAEKAVALYHRGEIETKDAEALFTFIAQQKPKIRQMLAEAILAKKDQSSVVANFVHTELLRLTREKQAEQHAEYAHVLLTISLFARHSELAYSVTPFLAHPRAELRSLANTVLAAIKDERIYPLLGQLLAEGSPIEQIYALETLLALKDERSLPLLQQQLANSNKNVRYFALKAIGAIGVEKAQSSVIQLAMADPEEDVRIQAVSLLAQCRTPAAFTALQKLIADPLLKVRAQALVSALAHNDKRYANAISEQLARETESQQKHALLKALLQLGHGGGMQGIFAILKKENDPELLLQAAFACSHFADNRCSDHFAALLEKNANESLAIECLMGLAALKSRKHLALLLNAIQDSRQAFAVRSAALAAVAQLENEAAIPALFAIYDTEKDQALRVQTRQVLLELMKKLPKP